MRDERNENEAFLEMRETEEEGRELFQRNSFKGCIKESVRACCALRYLWKDCVANSMS